MNLLVDVAIIVFLIVAIGALVGIFVGMIIKMYLERKRAKSMEKIEKLREEFDK